MANFKRFSRYTGGTVAANRSNQNFLVLRRPLGLEPDSTDTVVIVTQELEKRPDLVSFKAYGSPDLWWVIYEFNMIRDPFFELLQGQILRIPSIERVMEAIDNLGT